MKTCPRLLRPAWCALVCVLAVMTAPASVADTGTVTTSGNGVAASVAQTGADISASGSGSAGPGHADSHRAGHPPARKPTTSCTHGAPAGCAAQVACAGIEILAEPDRDVAEEFEEWCPASVATEAGSGAGTVRIRGDRASRHLAFPASPLTFQPGGGQTIVNFPTIAYTAAPRHLSRSLTLLGHRFDVRITATAYIWRWGDGRVTATDHPGRPYRATDTLRTGRAGGVVTHRYLRRGTYTARLDTTYASQYRLDHGPWKPVAGTVTIAGTPVTITADTYTPVLVGAGR